MFASERADLLGSAKLLGSATQRLDQIAAALLMTPERKLVIDGFTDSRGSDGYNLDLSRRRAEAIRAYIIGKGYEPERIIAVGMGGTHPVADNATPAGRASNRRVEIVIQPESQVGGL
jgi:outer membrane protein OmpA-like peptidoglycan-associated protein